MSQDRRTPLRAEDAKCRVGGRGAERGPTTGPRRPGEPPPPLWACPWEPLVPAVPPKVSPSALTDPVASWARRSLGASWTLIFSVLASVTLSQSKAPVFKYESHMEAADAGPRRRTGPAAALTKYSDPAECVY